MTKKEKLAQEKEEIKARLLDWIKPGDTVYTVLRHCSRSGMSRVIQLIVFDEDRDLRFIGWNASRLMDRRWDDKRDGIQIGGCGMDMGFALVYELSSILFNGQDRAGYVLNHRWL